MKKLLVCLILALIGCAPSPEKSILLKDDLGKEISMESEYAPHVWCIDISDLHSKGSMWVTRGEIFSDASHQLYFAPKACPLVTDTILNSE